MDQWKLAERERLLGRCAASSLADARDHRRFAPATGFAARSRRTRLIIYLGFESREGFPEKIGGERGIRTLDGLLTHTPLAGVRLRPLGHLSEGRK
jgi:hypothetical protein